MVSRERAKYSQVISEDLQYDPEFTRLFQRNVTNYINCRIVSIIGPQATGKSTLMNDMLGLSFPTQSDEAMSQTSKGINAAISEDLIVLDTEGTDSFERGEGGENIENKFAMFILATSHVIIMNLQATSLLRKKGSCFDTLKTIFELRDNIIGVSQRKTIVLAIRDSDGKKPTSIQQNVIERLKTLDDELMSGNGSRTSIFEEFNFVVIPFHNKLGAIPNEYIKEVLMLKNLLRNPTSEIYIGAIIVNFKNSPDHFNKIWESIDTYSALNLASHLQQIHDLEIRLEREEAVRKAEQARWKEAEQARRREGSFWKVVGFGAMAVVGLAVAIGSGGTLAGPMAAVYAGTAAETALVAGLFGGVGATVVGGVATASNINDLTKD